MSFTVEPKVLQRRGLTVESFGILLLANKYNIPKKLSKDIPVIRDVNIKGFLDSAHYGYKLNKNKLFRIIEEMKEYSDDINLRALELAPKLIEIFPSGKKPGTNLYWKGSKMEIVTKLKKFLNMFGEEYSNEDIIDATQRYVQSFNGSYGYMRVLKYFIWKNILRVGEESNSIEEVSDLATWLENKGNDDALRQDWLAELI